MVSRFVGQVPERPAVSVREAGRMGGVQTAARYGRPFYEQIGHKGGTAVSDKYGHEHFETIGRKGASIQRRRRDLAERIFRQAAELLAAYPEVEQTQKGANLRQSLTQLTDLAA